MENQKDKWLARQINAAKKNLDDRPKWMNRASHFEGSNCGTVLSSNELSFQTDKSNKTKKPPKNK